MSFNALKDTLESVGKIGWSGYEEGKGRDCLPWSSNEDKSADAFLAEGKKLQEAAKEAGLNVDYSYDTFGNAYVTLEGESTNKILITSHLDSVPHGGRFDGIVGVSSGLAAIKYLIHKGIKPKKSVQVAAFRAEESSVTGQSCLGSLLATGALTVEELAQMQYGLDEGKKYPLLGHIKDNAGLTTAEIREALNNPPINIDEIDGALEVHIEQSGVLEKLGRGVAVVTGGIGTAVRSEIKIHSEKDIIPGGTTWAVEDGTANHSGGTPMNGETVMIGKKKRKMKLRDDALVKAVKQIASENGRLIKLVVPGGSYNTVPGRCEFEYIVPDDEATEVECLTQGTTDAVTEIISETESIAEKIARETRGKVRATIGYVTDKDGVITLYLDERMLDEDAGAALMAEVRKMIADVADKTKVKIDYPKNIKPGKPAKFRGDLKDKLSALYEKKFGKKSPEMSSMPGHDLAKILKQKSDGSYVPGAMIYIRSMNDGVSHNPAEFSTMKDIEDATELLCEFIEQIANE